jgi:hypothetical protein
MSKLLQLSRTDFLFLAKLREAAGICRKKCAYLSIRQINIFWANGMA